MSSNDADELDDASMKSMRAVWLTMRDEEPPSSGMSALLAAAREKAEQMSAKPSWFERALGFLRRPPALAFATVMILIGGAVLVTKNTADKKTDAETSSAAPTMPEPPERSRDDFGRQPQMAPADPETTPVPTATIDPHAGMGSGAVGLPPPLESPPRETPTVKAKPKSPPKDLRKPPDAPRDAKAQRPTGKTVDDLTDKPAKVELGSVREDNAGGVVQGRGEGTKIGTDTAAPSIDSNAPPPAPEPPQHKRPAVKESGDEAEQDTVTGTKKPTTPPVEQLKNQAESAASRGDCTAVKVIVARIKKQDESYYKTRVTTNTTIKKCL